MVQSEERNRSKYAFLVKGIKENLEEHDSRITHVNCSQNTTSDFLAKISRTKSRTVIWLGYHLPEVVDLCKEECNFVDPCLCFRRFCDVLRPLPSTTGVCHFFP